MVAVWGMHISYHPTQWWACAYHPTQWWACAYHPTQWWACVYHPTAGLTSTYNSAPAEKKRGGDVGACAYSPQRCWTAGRGGEGRPHPLTPSPSCRPRQRVGAT
eukprot:350841-Chlamydomonas_euryale.AAC.17